MMVVFKKACFHNLFVLILCCPIAFCQVFETLQTGLGTIRGEVVSTGTNRVYQFKSIPYAKPPLGTLRFQKPQPYGQWNGVLDATKTSPSCVQQNNGTLLDITEDCLFLNIYVPNQLRTSNSKSVMVWIHGGNYEMGQASTYDGSALALKGDVIVVTINYRLLIFGFLTSGDSRLPGNYGLWDQRMAIQWVKDNIASFGGNPSSITLFGESAGAYSVHLHALSPLNQGLFQRVILQSGTATSKISLVKSGHLETIGSYLGCINSAIFDSDKVVECMQGKTSKELLDASLKYIDNIRREYVLPLPIGPVVDKEFIPDDPVILLNDVTSASYKFFRTLDIIVGTNNAEGVEIAFLAPYLNLDLTDGITTTMLCDFLSRGIGILFYNNVTIISQAICDKYKVLYGDLYRKEEQGRQVINMYGDLFYVSPAVDILNIHSNGNTITKSYQYSFQRDLFKLLPMPSWSTGAHHGAELGFLFGLDLFALFFQVQVSIDDRKLSDYMLAYWTNFAKTGNPNSGNNSTVPQWLEYNYEQKNYLEFDEGVVQKSYLLANRIEFWLETVQNISSPVIDTSSGAVRGMSRQYPTGVIYQFKGIPFAKPPVGNLRFSKPEPVERWTGIMDATRYKSSCMQASFNFLETVSGISEDCLFLNIFVPRSVNSSNRKSVMVWIHGGAYVLGTGATYDGSALALKGDVIVVNLNYRLGVFGLLTSGDSTFKGNYALWDQKLAIEWVKDNIAVFGGNPDDITIFGESAGGFCSSLQALNPLNRGLFKRVILQSGTALSPSALNKNRLNLAFHYANALNCSTSSMSAIASCLRSKPAVELLSASALTRQLSTSVINFEQYLVPVVDGEFILDDPNVLLRDKSSDSYKFFRSLDLMTGVTTGEGSLFLQSLPVYGYVYGFNVTEGVPKQFMCETLIPAITAYLNFDTASASNQICQLYSPKISPADSQLALAEYGRQTITMVGDVNFVVGTEELLNLHSNNNYQSNSYKYLFSRRLPAHLEISPLPSWFQGSSHASDIFHLFGFLSDPAFVEADFIMSDKMMTYWINFAKTGDPNAKGLPRWSDFKYANRKMYLDFGSDGTVMRKEMLWPDRMKLWFDLKGVPYIEETENTSSHAYYVKPSLYIIFLAIKLAFLK